MNRRTALLAVTAVILAAAGCESPSDKPSSTRPTAPDHSGQSLWHVIDEDGRTIEQLPDDDPLVTLVRKTVVLHSGVVDTRDHKSVAPSIDDELSFYNKDFAATLRSQQYPGKLTALFTRNKLATRQKSVAWYRSTFPRDRKNAKVEMEATFEFTAAAPDYLKKNKLELHTPYTQRRSVSLAEIDGRWLITRIEKNPLTRPAKTLPGTR
ncbi:hypothetical protein ACFYOG_04830 [Streptomyces sp. NPDC007818]|uniref:hypothetical protein n=1 Tax=Streptomyces sp. NPDC007818 TaxID=3364780 RepID=UPI0036B916D5